MNLISITSCGYFGFRCIEEGYRYYYVDLPNLLAAKNMSSNVEAKAIGVKIVMDDLGLHTVVNDLVAEESIESLIPKLIIK